MKKIKLILNESLVSNKDSDIIEDTAVAQKPDYQIIDITVIPDETYYPTIQSILIDLDEGNKLKESDGNKLDINILSETVNTKTGYSNSLFEFESSNKTITLSLVLQESSRRGVYKVEAYTTKGIKVFESNTYKPRMVIESYLNSLANEYLIDKPLKETDLSEAEDVDIYTNKTAENTLEDLRKRFKTSTNKEFIKNTIDNELKYGFITPEDAQALKDEFLEEAIEDPAPNSDPDDYSVEEFTTSQNLTDQVLDLPIDYSEWNEATPEERAEMVKPELQKFLNSHRSIFDRDPKIFDLLQYNLIDLNFHTEAKVLKDLYRGGNI